MNDAIRFQQIIASKLSDLYDEIERGVRQGNCASFEDYKYRVGKLAGLTAAFDTMDEAIQEFLKNDDEE